MSTSLRSSCILTILCGLCGVTAWGQIPNKHKPMRANSVVSIASAPSGDLSSATPATPPLRSRAFRRQSEPRKYVGNDVAASMPNSVTEYGAYEGNAVLTGLYGTGYVAIPNSGDFAQTFDGTIEMWVKPDSVIATQELMAKGTTDTLQFLFGIRLAHPYFRIGTTPVTDTVSSKTIPTGQWTHLAVTWDGGSPYNVKFYINGEWTGSTYSLNDDMTPNTDSVIIGAPSDQQFSPEYFRGEIDEVRLWNPALNESQIAQNRFVGLGDVNNANLNSALTWSSAYSGLICSWTFNTGGWATDWASGDNGFMIGSALTMFTDAGVPIPYNLALYLGGNDSSNVIVPSNSQFDQNVAGTLEMWISPSDFSNTPVLMSKGATSNQSFLWGIGTSGVPFVRIGTYIYTDTSHVPLNKWSHVAVTWTGGPTFTVSFYFDGQFSSSTTHSAAWNINTDSLYIGGSQNWPSEGFSGYIDEVRFWGIQRALSDIRKDMFVAGRSLLPDADLIALWSFEGNLGNYSAVSGIDGTFNNRRLVNDARFSGYRNETQGGTYYGMYPRSHSTTLSYGFNSSDKFPVGYSIDVPWETIPDNDTTGIARQITISTLNGPLTSVEAFLSIEHTYIGDLVVTLTAPNGVSRKLLSRNAGGNENVLSFFSDGYYNSPGDPMYLPPWAYVKPIDAFGNFGGSNANGTWTLKVSDNASGDIGVLKGWGLRLNNNTTGVTNRPAGTPAVFTLEQNYPNPFNPSTAIKYELPRISNVTLAVYDILGREVAVLVNERKAPGSYTVQFNASRLSSGVYFYRLQAESFVQTRKLLLLK